MSTSSQHSRRGVVAMTLFAGVSALEPSFAQNDELSPDAFRDLVVAMGARHYPSLPMRPLGRLEVAWGDHHLYLYNAYAGIRALPPEQRERAVLDFIRRFSPEADAKVAARVAAAEHWDTVQPLLRPKMFPAATVAAAPRILHQPFSTDVVVGYAIDLGDKDLYADQRRFTQWGVPLQQVHATALSNLEAMSAELPTDRHVAGGGDGFIAIATNDGYDAARILLPKMRARLISALGPTIFAGIPGRDLLMFWPQHFDGHEGIEQLVLQFSLQMPHPLTREIFAVDKDGVRKA